MGDHVCCSTFRVSWKSPLSAFGCIRNTIMMSNNNHLIPVITAVSALLLLSHLTDCLPLAIGLPQTQRHQRLDTHYQTKYIIIHSIWKTQKLFSSLNKLLTRSGASFYPRQQPAERRHQFDQFNNHYNIPHYWLFRLHFAKMLINMRKYIMPLYLLNPADISNLYAPGHGYHNQEEYTGDGYYDLSDE